MIEHLHREAGYPIDRLCHLVGLSRSSYYYRPHPRDDREAGEAILAAQGRWPTYGYRRLTAEVRRDGPRLNSKRMRRIRRGLGLQPKRKAKKRRTTNSQHGFPRYPNLVQGLTVTRPEHVGPLCQQATRATGARK